MLVSIQGSTSRHEVVGRGGLAPRQVGSLGTMQAAIRRLIVAAVLAQALVAPAMAAPLLFEKVATWHITSPYSVTTANFFFRDSFSGGATQSAGYHLNASMQTFGIDFTATPADWILDLLGVESVLGVGKTGATTVSYSTSLWLIGDVGSKALVSGFSTVGGYYNHQISSLPSGDARSSVSGLAQIFGSGQGVQTSRHHDNYVFYSDYSAIEPLAGDQWDIAPFEMLVGEVINLSGYFTVSSFAAINDVCFWGVCVPGAGPLALSQTIGNFSVRLNIQEVSPVPEPPTSLLIVAGLLAIAYQARFRRREQSRG